ncbi:aldo/keto reductase [Mycoplasma sp. ATU-Cv-508]
MPKIGYGTWLIEPQVARERVLTAYKVGYRHFDTAQVYNNEYEIGQAIEKLDRHKLFITTKVWLPNYNSEEIFLKSVRQSLERLKVRHVDLLLLHWPVKGKNVKAYQYLEKAKDLGLTKSIGVSNFMVNHLEEILEIARHKPVVNQIEFQPLVQQKQLVKFCQDHDIAVTGYSNLKSYLDGRLTARENAILTAIAQDIKRSVPQVILRWVYQSGIILIPKSSSESRMAENLAVVNFSLTDEQMEKINSLDHDNYDKAEQIYLGHSWAGAELKKPDFLFEKHFK